MLITNTCNNSINYCSILCSRVAVFSAIKFDVVHQCSSLHSPEDAIMSVDTDGIWT